MSHRFRWIAISGVAALAASFLTKTVLRFSWNAATGEDPPMNPADTSTAWSEAATWTVAASVVAGLSSLAARRATAEALDGSVPDDRYS